MVHLPYVYKRSTCRYRRLGYLRESEAETVPGSGGLMSLRLSSAEIAAIERANSVLLAPFSYESAESWRRAAAHAVADCVGADASSFEMLLPGAPLIAADPDVARALSAVDPAPDWVVGALTVRRRQLGLTVTDWEELFDAREIKRGYFYNEIVRPQHLLAPVTMLKGLRESPLPAALTVYFADETAARRHVSRRKEILRLLFPAYGAGVRIYVTLRQNADTLKALAEQASIGVLTFDTSDRLLGENEFFERLMCSDPDRDRVRAEVVRAVHGFASLSVCNRYGTRVPQGKSEFRTAAGCYRIITTRLEQTLSGESGYVVALVERVESHRVDGKAIASRFSLTQRQLDCAIMLATGLSSKEIAVRLGISTNTARRHVESIFLKLDVHNRLAAVAKLTALSLVWFVGDMCDLITVGAPW
jgi:DNA-binding CsgD family transcriptional regulator